MGEVIGSRAQVSRIEDHVRRSLRAALARSGEVAQAAETRLGPAVAAVDAAASQRNATAEAEAVTWAALIAEDANSDTGIGKLRDAMWSALGRPRRCPPLDQVFPGGVATYTHGDPRRQPVLMEVLRSRVLSASAPRWSPETRTGWAADIEALRSLQQAAVDAHRPAEAAATVADVGYRSAVRTAQASLRAFKRDLRNLGLTETQIHEIIPDATPAAAAPASTTAAPAPAPIGVGSANPPPSSA